MGETHKNWVVCYSLSNTLTPKVVWTYESPKGGLSTPPLITDDGGVVLAFKTGRVSKLELKADKELWSQNLVGVYIDGPITSYQGNIYLPTYSGIFYKLNSKTGATEWAYEFAQKDKVQIRSTSKVIFSNGSALLLDDQGDLLSINTKKGTLNWNYSPPIISKNAKFKTPMGEMLLHNKTLYVARYDGKAYAVELKDKRRLVWKFEVPANITAAVASTEDNIFYLGDSTGKLHALDLTTGKRLWQPSLDLGDRTISHISFYKDSLYVTGSRGKLFRIDKKTKKIEDIFDLKTQLLSTPIFIGKNYSPSLFKNDYLLLPSNKEKTMYYVYWLGES